MSEESIDQALLRKSYDQREEIAKARLVRTPAGAKRYGVPIGTPISAAKAKQQGRQMLQYQPGKGKLSQASLTKPGAKPIGRSRREMSARLNAPTKQSAERARRRQAARLGVEELKTKSGAKIPLIKPEGGGRSLGSDARLSDFGLSPSKMRARLDAAAPPLARRRYDERAKRMAARRRAN